MHPEVLTDAAFFSLFCPPVESQCYLKAGLLLTHDLSKLESAASHQTTAEVEPKKND
jgi:hypothetical protein